MAKIDYDDSQSESLHIRAANSLRSEAALIKNELTREQIQKALACETAYDESANAIHMHITSSNSLRS